MPFMTSNDPSIIIVGGGIGGLTTALHLHAHGFKNIHLYESAPVLAPLGVGINVQPSAVLILRRLGLLPALESIAIKTKELNYYNRHGDSIIQEPRGLEAGYKVPQFSIHRGEFQMMLLDAVKERLGPDRIHLGHRFTSFSQDETAGTITATFKRSSDATKEAEFPSKTGDMLIAADGINSTVRRILYPNEGPPRFSGRILWRGCVERDAYLTGASMVWAGHANQKFVAYPISNRVAMKGKSLVNWICELRVREEGDPDLTPPVPDWNAISKEKFLGPFEEWRDVGTLDVGELVGSTERIYEFPMCDRDPVDRWSFGRLTLLGDAAHPMYPIGSNGASQAILDAEALTTSLLSHSKSSTVDIPTALTKYQTTRLPSTAKIVLANRANGPDHVMQVAEERAPDGFKNIHDIISKEELDGIGIAYKAIAGFEIEAVNKKVEEGEELNERLGLKSPKAWVQGAKGENSTGVVGVSGVE
ncbi:FAD/NAD(P)-binding domain-containing protein [Venturia nashicola]|nr:FAD/NAD(P)-binding domain-containing protein [Venturia nashicola]